MIVGMPKQSMPVILSAEDRQQLEQWQTSHSTPQQVALHCRIVLAAADGQPSLQIAAELNINRSSARAASTRSPER